MKTRFPALTLGAVVALGLAAVGGAQQAIPSHPGMPLTGTLSNPWGAAVSGTVESVERIQSSLQIQDAQGQTHWVKVNDNTRILRGNVLVQLSDLNAGDSVTVRNPTSTW
jgi:hypothetical protein